MELILPPRPICGTVRAVSSKSQAHRLLIAAALADRPSEVVCERSLDVDATVRCLTAFGADISRRGGVYTVVPGQAPAVCAADCGESGATLRFLLPVAAALGIDATFSLHGRLPERPLSPLWEALKAHGAVLSRPTDCTIRCAGKLRGGSYQIAGNVSSQFISGLLFALPLTGEASELRLTTPPESLPYLRMTRETLAAFGVSALERPGGWDLPAGQRYRSCGRAVAEGDWSNAAFWLCAGAISAPVTVTGLNPDSAQGDRKIVSLLSEFGAEPVWSGGGLTVAPRPLRGVCLDARQTPDLVPPLALLGACAEGQTTITGAARLRFKESDRLQSVADVLNALGGHAEVLPDGLRITGGRLRGASVSARNDHRIAMLAAVASAVCAEPVRLSGAEATEKSYPRFWDDLAALQKEAAT